MYHKLQGCVGQGQHASDHFAINRGIRPVVMMSPALFRVYLSDLPKCCESVECDPITIGSANIGCLIYADDVILSKTAGGLQRSLPNLNHYSQMWKLQINVRKTKIMIFNPHKNLDVFKIGDKIIQHADSICYLGFMLTPSGNFNSSVKLYMIKLVRHIILLNPNLVIYQIYL